jgi:hypothetical protein
MTLALKGSRSGLGRAAFGSGRRASLLGEPE